MSRKVRTFSLRWLMRWRNRAARVLAAILVGDFRNTVETSLMVTRSLPLRSYEQWRSLALPPPRSRSSSQDGISILLVGGKADQAVTRTAQAALADPSAAVHFVQSFDSEDFQEALASIKCDLVFIMALGDRPRPDAICQLRQLFAQEPSLALAFCDHERRDGEGNLVPIFKPGWDAELQTNGDYLGPGLMLRRTLLPAHLKSVNQLLFSWVPSLPPDAVHHLALPLIESAGDWPSILEKQRMLRLPAQPQAWPLVSIIVPTRDQKALLAACLEGVLHQTDYPKIEVVLVDNGSREKDTLTYLEEIQADPRVRVIRQPGAFNFSRLNNRAAQIASGDVLVLLNNDTEVLEPGWLKALVAEVLCPKVGAVGALLLYPNRTVQHAGLSLATGGNAWHLFSRQPPDQHALILYPRQVVAVTGACLAIRRQVFGELGGLDEKFPVTFNDVDLCLRLRSQGLRILYTPAARLIHHESKSRGVDVSFARQLDNARNRRRLLRLHGKAGESDPFFNPNLTPGLGEVRLLRRRP